MLREEEGGQGGLLSFFGVVFQQQVDGSQLGRGDKAKTKKLALLI